MVAKTANSEPWLNRGAEEFALEWATENTLPAHFEGILKVVAGRVSKTRAAVRSRLISEISHWDGESARLKELLATGRSARMRPETAYRRARELEERLANRMVSLDLEKLLTAQVPHIRGSALVIPGGMDPARRDRDGVEAPNYPKDTARVERRAVDAVLAAERELDAEPLEMPPNNPGFDIRSVRADGTVVQIEVKGRIVGADDFTVTKNEVIHAKNLGDTHRLALVEVSAGPADEDRLRYVTNAFDDTDTDDFTTTKYVKDWKRIWRMGGDPR
ncbi:DUF3883 domain-containing protein [Promicromonospora sp. Populi]|uniref:DUF3883 domain-containing protein n=1 Tax=Promicromonospora sp. Populi TaxID=3239420 RepID=UPI0034E21717